MLISVFLNVMLLLTKRYTPQISGKKSLCSCIRFERSKNWTIKMQIFSHYVFLLHLQFGRIIPKKCKCVLPRFADVKFDLAFTLCFLTSFAICVVNFSDRSKLYFRLPYLNEIKKCVFVHEDELFDQRNEKGLQDVPVYPTHSLMLVDKSE